MNGKHIYEKKIDTMVIVIDYSITIPALNLSNVG